MVSHYWKRGEDGVGKPDPKNSDYPICVRYIVEDVGWYKHSHKVKKWPVVSYERPKPKNVSIDLSKYENNMGRILQRAAGR